RVRERGRQLDVDGAVGVGRHATRVRELAKPGTVRPHREDLLPERVRADEIAARREQHRPADLIGRGAERPDSAARRAEYAPDPVRLPIPRKARDLTEAVAPCANGEELADLARVLSERVRRRLEEHPVTNDDATSPFATGGGVITVERGQLQDLVAVEQEDLA